MAADLPPLGAIHAVPGVTLAAAYAGVKAATAGAEPGTGAPKDDLALLAFAPGTQVAGVLTQSRFAAAPVLACRALLGGPIAGFLINSGNANAATGAAGLDDAVQLQDCAQRALGGDGAVMSFSTGVIGERLPIAALQAGIEDCASRLAPDAWLAAATAIMTTDTAPKVVSLKARIGEGDVLITGMAKGSGMIEPDMATMLSYVFCDAQVPYELLQPLCKQVADVSFNRVSIDGDTSTNDCFMLAATGAGNVRVTQAQSTEYQQLRDALEQVAVDLAQRIARDGEGVSKFVTLRVAGGATDAECRKVARTVANSPLVKTALFASDPNWGRICMAMGRAGVDFAPEDVHIDINGVAVVRGGVVAPGYTEALGAGVMSATDIDVAMTIGSGSGTDFVWTTDLSHDYVTINSEYRT